MQKIQNIFIGGFCSCEVKCVGHKSDEEWKNERVSSHWFIISQQPLFAMFFWIALDMSRTTSKVILFFVGANLRENRFNQFMFDR